MNKINYFKSHVWMRDREYIREFVNLIALNKHGHALDAGSGSGYVSAEIKPKVKKLLQIDHDWAMLDRNNLAKHVDTLKADLSDLWMVGNSTFDYVLSRSVMHRLKQPGKVYQEFVRILKTGGKLIVSVSQIPDEHQQEFRHVMKSRGYRLNLTTKQWRKFFMGDRKMRLVKEGKIFFNLNLNKWGLLKEHKNASQGFKEYFKFKNGIIECNHSYFVLEKI